MRITEVSMFILERDIKDRQLKVRSRRKKHSSMREFHFPIGTQNARKVFGDALNLDPIVTVYDYRFPVPPSKT